MEDERVRLRMSGMDWLLLLVLCPVVISIAPLLTARGAITGARTFESSYLLTIPGFIGICFLSTWYARPVAWRLGRRRRQRAGETVRPAKPAVVFAFLLLLIGQVLLYLALIRIGFVFLVEPLRPPLPGANIRSMVVFEGEVPGRGHEAAFDQVSLLNQNHVLSPADSGRPSPKPRLR